MNYFERLLEEKSKLDNSYDYFTQWEYDKKLYEDILLGIRDYYSNYTDHGNNHSETILTNILRMFGEEELRNLSSFDIWLLLEASYLHDCGMYISREEAERTLKNNDFISYLKEICETPSHPMNKFTKTFKIKDDKIFYENLEYNITLEYNMKFLISSYKRRTHAQDIKNVVFNKSKLLPERIYYILSIISKVHGESFEEIMDLPKKESGIGRELGHPRFIACLLRMGDLLDIDNNRISPSIIKNIIDIIPKDSKFHLEKHRSISHIWIDEEKIEITASINCGKESYEVAEVTGKWFDYIREEYNNQLYNWKLIIPNNFKGILPRLGELKIDIQDYEYIDTKYKPKFSVDTNNVLELLVGASIYNRKENALREILQNSMDATYLRIFEEKREEILKKKEISIKEIKKLFKGKEIIISIKKNLQKSDEDVEYNYWDICIEDRGIGIDRRRLRYLIEAGSSYKDKTKMLQINDMPNWLKPSGNFGIGFQSIFLLTNKVRIESRSFYTPEVIDVDLIKPSAEKQESGNIYFRKVKLNYKQEIGTKLSFEYKTLKNDREYLEYKRIDFDPLQENNLDFKIYKIIEEIEDINKYSFIQIKVKQENKNIELASKIIKYDNEVIKYNDKYLVYIPELEKEREGLEVEFLYKNQNIASIFSSRIKYLWAIINIIGYRAKEVLNLDRNYLKSEFIITNFENILQYVYEKIEKNYLRRFAKLNKVEKEKICKFYFYYEKEIKKIYAQKLIIVSKYKNTLREYFYTIPLIKDFTIEKLKDEAIICINEIDDIFEAKFQGNDVEKDLLELIIRELLKINKYQICLKDNINENKEKEGESEKGKELILTKIKSKYNIIDEKTYIKELIDYEEKIRRVYVYCNEKNFKLRQKEITHYKNSEFILGWWSSVRFIHSILEEKRNVLFPFYFVNEKTVRWNEKIRENYIKFCYKNRVDRNLTQKEFTIILDRYVEYLEKELKEIGINVEKNNIRD